MIASIQYLCFGSEEKLTLRDEAKGGLRKRDRSKGRVEEASLGGIHGEDER